MDLRPLVLAVVVSAACGGHEAALATRHEARVFAGGVMPPAGSAPALENPFHGDRRSAVEGERTFGAMNCDGCHGGGAAGSSPFTDRSHCSSCSPCGRWASCSHSACCSGLPAPR